MRETVHGTLLEWSEVEQSTPGIVRMRFHNLFAATSETVTEELSLSFRTRDVVAAQLTAAGFDVHAVYGDWQRHPFTPDSSVMVFVARAR